jgi:lysophospholipase L1-like esterase
LITPVLATLLLASCSTELPGGTATVPPVGSPAPSAGATPDEQGLTVAFLGDSITSGFGDIDYTTIWPEIVSDEYGWRLEQFSVAGTGYLAPDTATSFGSRVRTIVAARPDVVVIAGGTNDVMYPVNEVTDAAADVLDTLAEELPDTQIVLLSAFFQPALISGTLPDGRDVADIVDEQTDALQNLAEERGIRFIDTRPLFEERDVDGLILPDGVHPNNAGHEFIAEYLGPLVAEAIAVER